MSDAPTAAAADTASGTVQTVCDELVAAVQQHKSSFRTQRDNEIDNAFIERLLQAIADVPDPIYEALSPGAQQWFAEAAATANTGGLPTPPAGFVSAHKPKQSKQARKKKLIERKPSQPYKAPGPTMGTLIRRAIIDNRNVTVQELESMLAANEFTDIKRTTVFSFQRGSLDTLKVAELMGRFSWPEAATPVTPATAVEAPAPAAPEQAQAPAPEQAPAAAPAVETAPVVSNPHPPAPEQAA